MIRQSWKSLLFGTVVVAMLLATVDNAKAWWGCYRPVYYGCSPCVSVCDPCGGWYAGYRPYPSRMGRIWCWMWMLSLHTGCVIQAAMQLIAAAVT